MAVLTESLAPIKARPAGPGRRKPRRKAVHKPRRKARRQSARPAAPKAPPPAFRSLGDMAAHDPEAYRRHAYDMAAIFGGPK